MEEKERFHYSVFSGLKRIGHWFTGHWDAVAVVYLSICMMAGSAWYSLRYLPPQEIHLRQTLVQNAELWLGFNEADGSHQQIVDCYNTFTTSPRGYTVTYEDNWCAAFGSAVALKSGLTGIIPVECSCEQQINLFREKGCWQENECYLPHPGDYIYYVWDEWRKGDCTAWADHVGIVAETFGPIIKVIEGNMDDCVSYRYLFLNDICIRGFGLPDYKNRIQ